MMTSDDLKHRLIQEAHDLSQILERCADGGYALDRIKAECGDAVVMLSRLTTFIGSFRPAHEQEALTLLLRDLVRASASVMADWSEFGEIQDGRGYAHWEDCIDAASGYLAKDAPSPINLESMPPTGALGALAELDRLWRARLEGEYSIGAVGGAAKPADLSAPDMRESLRRAYEQGCVDTHKHWRPDRDPDFTEAAYDYADAFLAASTGGGDGR